MIRGVKASRGCSPAVVDPHLQLAAAILAQACLDAKSGDLGALLWIGNHDCEVYCDVLGYEHNRGLRLMTDILLDQSITLEYKPEVTNEQHEYA